MPLERCLAIRIFDCFIISIFSNVENLVVVFLSRGLRFLLGVLELLLDLETCGVDPSSGTVVVHSFLPFLQVLVNFTALDERLRVLWLHLKAQVQSCQSLLVLIQLDLANSLV